MFKLNKLRLVSLICLMGTVLIATVTFSQTPSSRIGLITEPPLEQILPFEAEADTPQVPTTIELQAKDSNGKLLTDAKLALTILTPAKNSWFTTDFPIVEGTKLLQVESLAPQGKAKFRQILPIRGKYELLVKVSSAKADSFTAFEEKLSIDVGENWLKYRNFAILALVLVIIGAIGGFVIGKPQKLNFGEIAPSSVRMLLSGVIMVAIAALLYINVSAELAQSHMSMAMSHPTETVPATKQSAKLEDRGLLVELAGDEQATVGIPANLEVVVTDSKAKQPVEGAIIKIKGTALEGGEMPFAYEGVTDSQGKYQWQQQFFDGAPHQLEAEVLVSGSSSQSVKVAREIEVEGVAPPLMTRLIVLGYLTLLVVLGFLVGFKFTRKSLAGLIVS